MSPDPVPSRAPAEVALEGTVERVTFYNPSNGFSVVRLRLRGRREPISVVGTLPAVQPGEVLALSGSWQIDPRHGAQFRPSRAEVRRPTDVEGIVRYLGSGLVRQIGPVLAKRIVAQFGARTLDVLDTSPERVREVAGIGPRRARAIGAAWAEHRALRSLMAFLGEHGLDTRFAPRLLAAYGADAPRILGANPYRLVADVPGLGFAAADRLGQGMGVRPTSPARIQAAVQAALVRAAEDGHTRQARPTLVEEAAAISATAPDLVEGGVTQLLAGGAIATRIDTLDSGPAHRATVTDTAMAATPVEHTPASGGFLTASAPMSAIPEANEPVADGRASSGPADTTPVSDGPTTGEPIGSPLNGDSRSATRDAEPPSTRRAGRVRIYVPPAAAQVERMDPDGEVLGLGLAGLVRAEEDLARRLLGLARRRGLPAKRVERWLAADAEAQRLSDEQRRAVATAATSGCFVLTGGPGVGKTTTTRALVRCLEALGRSVALAAPTGKAARRLGEVVGLEARTIHRLLGAGPNGFRHGPRDPLPYDVVVVDEASMLDTQLARSVVRAVGPTSQLILVGDADQLPSVGPGQVLRDLLASGRVPSARLETVFRQAAQSQIVVNAHLIRQGRTPTLARPPALVARASDCVFVAAPPARLAAVAAEWAAMRLPRLLGVPPSEVQAIAPLVRVCQTLNSVLQERLNPARGQAERPHGALPLRVGDRVIQTRNNYLLGVFNGDTGLIMAIDAEAVTVDFGDGRVVAYGAADVLDLDHAYGLTVHRAQGSEWPGAVVLVSSTFGPILSRNLLYTAITRARRAVVLVGDEAAIAAAVARTRDQERCTGLPVLLRAGASAAADTATGVDTETGHGDEGGAGAASGRNAAPGRDAEAKSNAVSASGVGAAVSTGAEPDAAILDSALVADAPGGAGPAIETLSDALPPSDVLTAPDGWAEAPNEPCPEDWPDTEPVLAGWTGDDWTDEVGPEVEYHAQAQSDPEQDAGGHSDARRPGAGRTGAGRTGAGGATPQRRQTGQRRNSRRTDGR